jgi:hypothetical protein
MSNNALEDVSALEFVRKLITPFQNWPAFKTGVIDKNGNVVRAKGEALTPVQRSSWGQFDILVANIKKLIAKLPSGNSKLMSIGAAYLLLKEDDISIEQLQALTEEVATNAVAGGKIAGIGVGPDGEPGKRKRRPLPDQLFRRGMKS